MPSSSALLLPNHAGCRIGAAVKTPGLNNDALYRELAATQFGRLSTENAFKMDRLCAGPNIYRWEETENIVTFAEKNRQWVHGHTLVWHRALPAWLGETSGPRTDWEKLLRTYVHTVVSRYRWRVTSWDVVNEAFNEDGSFRDNLWLRQLGPEYIPIAFETAAAADPGALLFYNDYGLEYGGPKREAVMNCLEDLRRRGLRVNGIGLQMHLDLNFGAELSFAETLECFAARGYLVHLSEFDISIKAGRTAGLEDTLLQQQADLLARLLVQYLKVPEPLRYGITFWGIHDAGSWLRQQDGEPDRPLLFDDDYQPKPIFRRLISELKSR